MPLSRLQNVNHHLLSLTTSTCFHTRQHCTVAPAFVAKRFYSAELSDAEFDSKWEAYFEDVSLTQREVRTCGKVKWKSKASANIAFKSVLCCNCGLHPLRGAVLFTSLLFHILLLPISFLPTREARLFCCTLQIIDPAISFLFFTRIQIRSGLNDLFAHDAVPSRVVLQAAFRATRRVNDFPT